MCAYNMLISPSVWMITVDTSVEWPKVKFGAGSKASMPFIYFYLFKSLKYME